MWNGERLKSARHLAGMSQRDLAAIVGVTAPAISKYERSQSVPSSGVLIRLARALGVRVEFFLRPAMVSLGVPAYRCHARLPRKTEKRIVAQVREWLERYLDIEALCAASSQFALPVGFDGGASCDEDAEIVARRLRDAWQLGLDPIESLIEVVEDHGIKVGLIEADDGFDALTLWANDENPVIVLRMGVPGDRQRFSLAHELGHLALEPADGADVERLAHRFAGAFLVPAEKVRLELGDRRHRLSMRELHSLKHKYGLSMQAWIHRAQDLGIISASCARTLYMQFSKYGWRREEPWEPFPAEEPQRMKRLVLRARAEGIISESRAAELLPQLCDPVLNEEARQDAESPEQRGSCLNRVSPSCFRGNTASP